MHRNYIKIAIRNVQRYTSYTIINVGGLALGIACGLLIFSLVKYHLSFDDFHPDADRIYRIVTEQHRDQVTYTQSVPNPLGKAFRDDHTFGEEVARICTFTEQLIMIEENGQTRKFKENEVAFAETGFFRIFNYPLIEGNIGTALREANTAVLTQRMARKYFGNESPLNKTFRLENKVDFTVTGVLQDLPSNTDRRTEIYLSYSTLAQYNEWFASDDSWGGISSAMQCFIRLRPYVTVAEAEAVLPDYVKKFRPNYKNVHHYKLQPLSDIHFDARYGGVMEKRTLWVLSVIGFFLVMTACVNFINLATAQAIHRSKEVGIRKVLGSIRGQLFWQFMTETGVITMMATILALAVAMGVLPYVNSWFHSRISIDILSDGLLVLFILLLAGWVTLLSGAYPGFILSGFTPASALKGKLTARSIGGFTLRRTLIAAQFAISQVLIIGLIVIAYQMRYAQQEDMGFDKEAVIMIPVGSEDEKMETLKNRFQEIPGVEKVTLCFSAPSSANNWRTSFRYAGRTEDEAFSISYRGGDEQYLSTFGLELVAGRNLLPSDTIREFLVNETFVKKLNLTSPEEVIGSGISANNGTWNGAIVGVVKDFHDQSFHEEINPIFIATNTTFYNEYAIKIKGADIGNTLAALERMWSETYPEKIYEYAFLDEQIAEYYRTEDTMMKLIQVFSLVAIAIGCMGLYGLVSFMIAQKTKEIGIRKALGGSVSHILWIFGKEFTQLVIIAFIIAAPIGWWLMTHWLENFTYSVDINAWIFVLAITVTACIALLTVSYQSFRAARINPVDALKDE